ncbi:MAG: hypothetical protein RIB03_11560 [Henriciella sp.]|uniref:hypothetical protein n=1 Tax=Henriciella sp. TaxID=1968823 RepID=UPI0032EBE9A9
MKWVGAIFIALLLSCQTASADRVEQAFASGRFLEAAELARAEGGADNYARAARALLADAVASGRPTVERLDEAEAMARQAVALDPKHPEGRLQLAIALSLKSREMSTREALDSGYGGMSRDLAEAVIEDDPDNVYAHGFMAVWNIEVVRRGGALGSAFMGASMRKARNHYVQAIETGQADPSLHWQYARALAALNARKYESDIEMCLERAMTTQAETALAELMQARARSFQLYVRTHSRKDIERAAEVLL